MRSISIFVALLSVTLTFAQNNDVDASQRANTNRIQGVAGGNSGTTLTGAATFYNPKFDREGSVYLFEDWNNSAVIYAKNNDGAYDTENINFNIQRSMFESKKRDSIRSYNFANIDMIKVAGRTFKSYYFEPLQRQKVFEVVYEGPEFTILKGYRISILEGNPNPMIARNRDKIIQRSTYYIDTDESLSEFRFNKRNILKTLGPVKAAMAKEYASKYGMSFSNKEDLKKILNYVGRQ